MGKKQGELLLAVDSIAQPAYAVSMQVFIDSGFLLFALFVLLIVAVATYSLSSPLGYFYRSPRFQKARNHGEAPQDIYFLIYVLITWACLIFIVPMALSFQNYLSLRVEDSTLTLIKIVLGPVLLGLIFAYGSRRKFLNWIMSIHWLQK